jgi:hypothetical protein
MWILRTEQDTNQQMVEITTMVSDMMIPVETEVTHGMLIYHPDSAVARVVEEMQSVSLRDAETVMATERSRACGIPRFYWSYCSLDAAALAETHPHYIVPSEDRLVRMLTEFGWKPDGGTPVWTVPSARRAEADTTFGGLVRYHLPGTTRYASISTKKIFFYSKIGSIVQFGNAFRSTDVSAVRYALQALAQAEGRDQ